MNVLWQRLRLSCLLHTAASCAITAITPSWCCCCWWWWWRRSWWWWWWLTDPTLACALWTHSWRWISINFNLQLNINWNAMPSAFDRIRRMPKDWILNSKFQPKKEIKSRNAMQKYWLSIVNSKLKLNTECWTKSKKICANRNAEFYLIRNNGT